MEWSRKTGVLFVFRWGSAFSLRMKKTAKLDNNMMKVDSTMVKHDSTMVKRDSTMVKVRRIVALHHRYFLLSTSYC